MLSGGEPDICDRCGNEKWTHAHEQICSPGPFDDGRCPMCGDEFEEYLRHLESCEGGRRSD